MSQDTSQSQTKFPKWTWAVFLIIVLAVAGSLYYYITKTSKQISQTSYLAIPATTNSTSSTSAQATIKNNTDLDKAQNDLNSIDLNSINSALNQNDTDASGF
ncbi:MAG TPA: hypothetical protein VJJ80_01800 [Patescibacteria group bacterium]|nr:hypothetical protein [Patescibacteria group bacterium]